MIPVSKPFIGAEEKRAVMEVLDSGYVVQGPRTKALEAAFATLCQTEFAVATSNGTTALHLALLANNIGPGDEVITTAFTFIATVNTILLTGAKPIFVDIDEESFNIDPALIEAAVTPKTKAIMPVHLYGYVCDMEAIQAIADKYNLAIIEDAAQAVGATFKGTPAGGFATGCFSLYATKNIMSVEGGMITTNDAAVAEKAQLLRSHGMKRRYYHDMLGFNFRMSDVHAAIGLTQMQRLPDFNAKRKANAEFMQARIESVKVPTVLPDYEHAWHQFTVRINNGRDRDAAVEKLREAGVGTGIFYPIPAHHHEYMKEHVGDLSLPVTEKLSHEVFSLPVHPQLSQADLEKIVAEVNKL